MYIPKIIIVKNEVEVGKIVSAEIINLINNNPKCVLGFATGSSPLTTYVALVEDYKKNQTDWNQVTTFNLDEYLDLTIDNHNSYAWFMHNNLFNHINVNVKQIHIPQSIGDVNTAAEKYETMIDNAGGIDLQILGIGVNGHIGFNEPPTDKNTLTHIVDLTPSTINRNARFFTKNDLQPTKAITMGIASILKAKKIILIAIGETKSEIMKKFLTTTKPWPDLPVSWLLEHNNVTVVMDMHAAEAWLTREDNT